MPVPLMRDVLVLLAQHCGCIPCLHVMARHHDQPCTLRQRHGVLPSGLPGPRGRPGRLLRRPCHGSSHQCNEHHGPAARLPSRVRASRVWWQGMRGCLYCLFVAGNKLNSPFFSPCAHLSAHTQVLLHQWYQAGVPRRHLSVQHSQEPVQRLRHVHRRWVLWRCVRGAHQLRQ